MDCMEYLKFIPIEDPGISQVIMDVVSHVGCSEATGWRALGRLKSIRDEISKVETETESALKDVSFLYQILMEMVKKFRKLRVIYPFTPEELGWINIIEDKLEGRKEREVESS